MNYLDLVMSKMYRYIKVPKSAYPKNYKLGSDNQGWLMELKNKVQVWFTGGPRVTPMSSFWKWREIPKELFVVRGKGLLRYENTDGSQINTHIIHTSVIDEYYLSRIQPWTRWHFAFMWPLGIHWSIIWKKKDVVSYPKYQSKFGIKKMFAGYLGWIRDSDKIYKPKIYMGGNFE